MTPLKPYLIRSLYDWINDNELTPHILVNANCFNTDVPREHIVDGKIVLNIKPAACNQLVLGDNAIVFNARFGGKNTKIIAPINSILAIYAKENGKGMIFDDETAEPEAPKHDKPTLRLVK